MPFPMEMRGKLKIRGGTGEEFYHLSRYEFRHLIFAVCRGLETLTGNLYIFIAKMAGGKGGSLAPSSWP